VNGAYNRLNRGPGAPRKLSAVAEALLVKLYYESDISCESLATQFNVSRSTLYNCVRRYDKTNQTTDMENSTKTERSEDAS